MSDRDGMGDHDGMGDRDACSVFTVLCVQHINFTSKANLITLVIRKQNFLKFYSLSQVWIIKLGWFFYTTISDKSSIMIVPNNNSTLKIQKKK